MTTQSPLLERLRHRSEACASDFMLDRLRLGEISEPVMKSVQAHVQGCATCMTRQRTLGEVLAPRLSVVRSRPRLRWAGAAALALAASAIAVLVTPATVDVNRTKGSDVLELYVKRPHGPAARVLSGETLAPGDAIRFQLTTNKPSHVAVVGMDSAGQVIIHFPLVVNTTASMGALRRELLPGSVVLDGVLGRERMTAIFCDSAVPLEDLSQSARRALAAAGNDPGQVGPLDLACRQASFLFVKAAHPDSR